MNVLAIMRTFSMMQEDMSPYMTILLKQLITKLSAVSKVRKIMKLYYCLITIYAVW